MLTSLMRAAASRGPAPHHHDDAPGAEGAPPPGQAAAPAEVAARAYQPLPSGEAGFDDSRSDPEIAPAPLLVAPLPRPDLLALPAPIEAGLSRHEAHAWETAAEILVAATLVVPSLAWGGMAISRGLRDRDAPGAEDRLLLGALVILWGGLGGVCVGALLARPLAPLFGAAVERTLCWRRGRSPAHKAGDQAA